MRALTFLALATALCLSACGDKNKGPTVMVGKDDAAMKAAVEQARASLPTFWALYEAKDPSRTEFAVNAKMPTPSGEFEAIWIGVSGHSDGKVGGVLANEPEAMPDKHLGTAVQILESDIEDWSYRKDGKTWGSYTTRVIIPRLSKEQQSDVRAQLSASPTEQAAP